MNTELELARKGRDYSTLKLWTVTWNDFSDSEFLAAVKYVRGFNFYAQLSGLGRWNKVVNADRFALRVLSSIEEALVEAGFVNLPAVETTIEPEGVLFRYEDSEFAFDLSFRGDGSVHLRRLGSTMETFHRWYTGFMPSMPAILTRAMAALDAEIQTVMKKDDNQSISRTSQEPIKDRVRVLRANFNFQITLHHFQDSLGESHKNLDVLRQNLEVNVPDLNGKVAEHHFPLDLSRYGRMDYRVSLRHEHEPGISQYLAVEGPSNADWRALFFDLSYVGENYYTAEGTRHTFNQELFLSSARCADAYISFFRDIALEGFVRSVVRDFTFETTPNVIS